MILEKFKDNLRPYTQFELLTKNYTNVETENYKISIFKLTNENVKLAKLKDLINRTNECMNLIEGEYVKLIDKSKHQIVMSNTSMEELTNLNFMFYSKGDILVGGLGLGLIIQMVQDKSDITSIIIIEKSQELIDLITSQIKFNSKVKIICNDVFNYISKRKFDYMYFDIWNTISSNNYEQMKTLTRRYLKYKKTKESLIMHWRKTKCKELYFQEKKDKLNE